MKKVLVIAGPTASGKTALSVKLAQQFGCEIISGDSIQVYRGMDIGSGKVTEEEMQGIRHYLIDILSPMEEYSAADFQKMARETIDVTLPGTKAIRGHKHPNQIALEDLERVFIGMGYEVVEGPEIEYDRMNFKLLNIPEDHLRRHRPVSESLSL